MTSRKVKEVESGPFEQAVNEVWKQSIREETEAQSAPNIPERDRAKRIRCEREEINR